jgi:putative ABC transport system permease protein
MLGFAIVYSSSVISLAERQRETATLRVMGFSVKEISGMLFKESILQTAPGILLGLPFGRLLAEAYIKSVGTDLYTLPVIIYPRTYLYAALLAVVFVYTAYKVSVRGLQHLDMIEVLKQGD